VPTERERRLEIPAVIENAPAKELERLLAKVDILEPLPPEQVERLASLSSSMRLEAGEAIALDGDRETLLLLASGWVRVHEPSAVGPELTISLVEEGTVVGQTGFAPRFSRALRVEALQPSSLLVLEWEDFENLVLRNPEVGIKTLRLLSKRLAVCEGRLSDMVHKEVPARLAGLIFRLSDYEGLVMGDGSHMIPTRYTHQQLASLVGSNREAVTRALGRLRKAGAVEIRRRYIYVTDADALERLAETGR
jgi:CRP/FNR family transcriptional regulator, cyclic AMP receptor protein